MNGKLYVSVIFDCFDTSALAISLDTNMKATLAKSTLDKAYMACPGLKGAIIHSNMGSQYTSELCRKTIKKYGIIQSVNSAGGRCHDNVICESMWARMKEELFYSKNCKSTSFSVEGLKVMVWRYFISCWNNRRICSSSLGFPPIFERKLYYHSLLNVS